jgi:N-formylglutamate deformylase
VVFFSRLRSQVKKRGSELKTSNNSNELQDQAIFNFYPAEKKFIGILSIPHSGELIPDEFESYLVNDTKARMQDVDYRVNELVDISELQKNGIAVMVSNIHRVCVDLNRSPDQCVLNWKSNSMGVQLVQKDPGSDENERLQLRYHKPYFTMLKSLIEELHNNQKKVSFIDLHSMPSRPTEYHLKINPNQPMERPDFCVSDISGKSCVKEFIDYVCTELECFSSNVTQNDPYFGGHITRHVDSEFNYTNNVQIEIKRGIYMDEIEQKLHMDLVSKLRPKLTLALINVFKKFDTSIKN